MYRVLISQPVTALDCVVHMPPPVVLRHVRQRRVDASLGSHCVRASGEELRYARGLEAFLCCTHCGPQARSTGPHYDDVVIVVDDGVLRSQPGATQLPTLISDGASVSDCCRSCLDGSFF